MVFDQDEHKWAKGPRELYDLWPADREAAHGEYLKQQEENNGCPFTWLFEGD